MGCNVSNYLKAKDLKSFQAVSKLCHQIPGGNTHILRPWKMSEALTIHFKRGVDRGNRIDPDKIEKVSLIVFAHSVTTAAIYPIVAPSAFLGTVVGTLLATHTVRCIENKLDILPYFQYAATVTSFAGLSNYFGIEVPMLGFSLSTLATIIWKIDKYSARFLSILAANSGTTLCIAYLTADSKGILGSYIVPATHGALTPILTLLFTETIFPKVVNQSYLSTAIKAVGYATGAWEATKELGSWSWELGIPKIKRIFQKSHRDCSSVFLLPRTLPW